VTNRIGGEYFNFLPEFVQEKKIRWEMLAIFQLSGFEKHPSIAN